MVVEKRLLDTVLVKCNVYGREYEAYSYKLKDFTVVGCKCLECNASNVIFYPPDSIMEFDSRKKNLEQNG